MTAKIYPALKKRTLRILLFSAILQLLALVISYFVLRSEIEHAGLLLLVGWFFILQTIYGGLLFPIFRHLFNQNRELLRTEKILKEYALKSVRMQEDQKFILASTHVGIWKWDVPNDILTWDDSLYDVYEVDKKDFAGAVEAWEKTLHPDDKERSNRELQDALKGIKEFDTSFSIITKDGRTKRIGAKAKVERDEHGQPTRMYGINWDKTKEYEAEQEIARQKSLAQHNAKLAAIGELAAGVGHEINNPLAIVKGYIMNMTKRLALEPPDLEYLRNSLPKIDKAADRIADIVKGLRSFSRTDAGTNSDFKIVPVIDDSLAMIQEIYASEGVQLTYQKQLDSKDAVVHGNQGKIQQVLMNLIANGKDATEGRSPRLLEVAVSVSQNYFFLKVSDNGVGIPAELQEKIFDPFYTTKDVNKGTGIGLALVHSIVSEHQGSLAVDSEVGTGTTFTVKIPLVTEFESKSPAKSNLRKGPINKNVLIVDDEEPILDVLSTLLTDLGMTTTAYSSARKALAEFKSNPQHYDAIISDIKMPEMDGPTFFKEISPCLKKPAKFFFITGGVNMDIDAEIVKLGLPIAGYFKKPLDHNTIYDKLSFELI